MSSEPIQITRLLRSKSIEFLQGLADKRKEWLYDPQLPILRVSSKMDRSRTEASKAPPPDCLTCGVCCAFALPVEVSKNDPTDGLQAIDIIADGAADDTVINRHLPRDPETAYCKHLGGKLCKSITCNVYEIRPEECRYFDVGSDRCHEFRRMYGLEPQLTEEELAIELPKFPPLSDQKISFTVITTESEIITESRNYDGVFEKVGKEFKMRITVFLDEDPDSPHTLHFYNPAEQTWFETDFMGMTLDEARAKIETETGQGVALR